MSIFDNFLASYELNRSRTLALLAKVEEQPNPLAILGWRPGPGRAHIGWQLMHVAVTEDIFASERLAPQRQGGLVPLWPRFRGGSTPDDIIPSPQELRTALEQSRRDLRSVLMGFSETQLGWIPEALAQRKLTLLDVLHILGWHEAHHQGQAHLTMNLFLASCPDSRSAG